MTRYLMGWDPLGFSRRQPPWELAVVGRKFCLCISCLSTLSGSKLSPQDAKLREKEKTHLVLLVAHSKFVQADTGPVRTANSPVCEGGLNRLMESIPVSFALTVLLRTSNTFRHHSTKQQQKRKWQEDSTMTIYWKIQTKSHNTQRTRWVLTQIFSPVNLNFGNFLSEKMRGSYHFCSTGPQAEIWESDGKKV